MDEVDDDAACGEQEQKKKQKQHLQHLSGAEDAAHEVMQRCNGLERLTVHVMSDPASGAHAGSSTSRFYVMSDLHTELSSDVLTHVAWPSDALETDALVAGDLGRVMEGSFVRALAALAPRFRHVYVTLGNHEFYNSARRSVDEVEAAARTALGALADPLRTKITLLQREVACTPEGVFVLGCTLWTPLLRTTTDAGLAHIAHSLADFRAMWMPCRSVEERERHRGCSKRPLLPSDYDALHVRDAAWLTDAVARLPLRSRAIVLTHHGLHPACNPVEHAQSAFTPAFVCTDPNTFEAVYLHPSVVACVSGHTHGREVVCLRRDGDRECERECERETHGPEVFGGAASVTPPARTYDVSSTTMAVLVSHCRGYSDELAPGRARFGPLALVLA